MSSAKGSVDIWEFVELGQWSLPHDPASEVIRHDFRAAWRWWRRRGNSSAESPAAEPTTAICHEEARRLLPEVDWGGAGRAWCTAVDGGDRRKRLALIGPPGTETCQILAHFARCQDCFVLDPPTVAEILQGGVRVLERLDEAITGAPERIVVVPQLERFYLRHALGLELVRHVIDRLWAWGGPLVLGCDSWAFAFFNQAFNFCGAMDRCLTVAAWDGVRLNRWLSHFQAWTDGSVVYGEARRPVCTPAREGEDASAADICRIVQRYAAVGRGNPEVAAAMLRRGIECDASSTSVHVLGGPTEVDLSWVDSVPTGPIVRPLLHALLLHNGLAEEAVCSLLPFSTIEIREVLARLANHAIILKRDGCWRVCLETYPDVRRLLARDGYLTDDF